MKRRSSITRFPSLAASDESDALVKGVDTDRNLTPIGSAVTPAPIMRGSPRRSTDEPAFDVQIFESFLDLDRRPVTCVR